MAVSHSKSPKRCPCGNALFGKIKASLKLDLYSDLKGMDYDSLVIECLDAVGPSYAYLDDNGLDCLS